MRIQNDYAFPTEKSGSFPHGSVVLSYDYSGDEVLVTVKVGNAKHEVRTYTKSSILISQDPDGPRQGVI